MEKDYKNIQGLNQSLLKKWDVLTSTQFEKYLKEESENKLHFDKGKYIEMFIFDEENVNNYFHVEDIKYPSDIIKKIIDESVKNIEFKEDNVISDFKKQIILNGIFENYGNGNYTDERIYNEVVKKGEDYFNSLKNANNKIIIPLSFAKNAAIIKDTLSKNRFLKDVINPFNNKFKVNYHSVYTAEEKIPNILFDYNSENLIITNDYKVVYLKGELDVEIITDDSLIVIDFKHTFENPQINGKKLIHSLKYDYQLAFYKKLVESNHKNIKNFTYINVFISENYPYNIGLYIHDNKTLDYIYNEQILNNILEVDFAICNNYFKYKLSEIHMYNLLSKEKIENSKRLNSMASLFKKFIIKNDKI